MYPHRFNHMATVLALFMLTTVWSAAQTTYRVATNGTQQAPYDTWANAFSNIQAAIDTAVNGDRVWVTNGTYSITNQINLGKGITVESVNGPQATIVQRSSGNIRIFSVSNASAFVSGFTMTNGYRPGDAPSGQGSGLNLSAGTVSNCIITGNSADRGSTVYLTGGLLTHSVISNNLETGNSGGNGGVYLNGGNAVIQYCTITLNKPGSEDNGIMALMMNGACTSRNCRIVNNQAYSTTKISWAVGISGTGGLLQNCLIAENPGRGINMSGAGRIENCTVSRNTVYGGIGNGMNMTAGQVQNTIVYYNGNATYVQTSSDFTQSGGAVSNSCMGILLAGGGNTAAPPLFRNPNGRDYSLLPGSPCIDTGTNLASVTLDLEGTARPLDGNADGTARHDMGAYEAPAANSGVLRCGFTAPEHERIGSLDATFTPFVAGSDTNIIYAGWAFGDGSTATRSDLAAVSHTYSPGVYTVTLTVSNSLSASATAVMTNDIRVAPTNTFVATNGSHTIPFDTWAKAATNIQPAIDALISTNGEIRTVTVSNGTYGITAEVTLQTPIQLVSLNGPDATVITRSSGTIRCVRLNHADAAISGFTITNGSNGSQGAGLYITAGTASNCVITGCTGNRGSAVYLTGANTRLTHSTIRNNLDAGNSAGCGGIRMLSGAVLAYCTIIRNRAGSEASGVSAIYMQGNSTVSNCVVTNNLAYNATIASIAVAMTAGDIIRNCLISDNGGRGLNMAGGTGENCTITRNIMYGDVGNGVAMSAGTVRNCIVWNNGTDNSKNLSKSGGAFEFSDVNPAEAGNGNKSTDPVFKAPATNNFHLDPASPLINAGTNVGWMTGATDLDGSNRLIATTVDMGCYEAPDPGAGPLSCNFDAPITEGLTNLTAVFTASASGNNTNLVYYWWTFGDSNTREGAAEAIVTNLYTSPGYYTVTLTVSNDAGETALRTKTDYIYVAPAIAYVATNGLHQAPFETWTKAATNIQAAIDIARIQGADATRVLVTNGVYPLGAQLELLKGITVQSVGGRSNTWVSRVAGSSRILWLNHSNAVFQGFTLTNGFVSGVLLNAGSLFDCSILGSRDNRGGGGMVMSAGTVSNCLFQGNYDDGNSGGCGGVVMSGGLMMDCAILRNLGGSSVSEVGGLRLTGGLVFNTLIVSNRYGTGGSGTAGGVALSGATLRNCLIAANQGRGLALSGGSALNCTVARNSEEGINLTSGGITNCIIFNNNNGGLDLTGAGTSYGFCCSTNLTHDPLGTGNINRDPLFVNNGTGYGTNHLGGNFRLGRGSPCIGTGVNSPWMLSATDLDGALRLLGGIVDMGAYESLPTPGTIFTLK